MVEIKINGKLYDAPEHYTLLQALDASGVEVPRFCFHERLSIAGNCRMCLVEVKNSGPKPVASCAINVRDLRTGPEGQHPEILTTSLMVKKARQGVMEFLLLNHPLDCPVCDQAGECDLQDQAMAFGMDHARYQEDKRSVEDKYLGPLIATHMTRCIHCTRCVRFLAEVAGTPDLGMTGRGENAEITTYVEQAITSELQGNIIDLCPVGALTARPYAFKARPWETSSTETIDVMDGLGCAIRVESRGTEIIRILPRVHEEINEEWISDKTRFICDGLRTQRLDRPFVRKDGHLRPASWEEAFQAIKKAFDKTGASKTGIVAGDLCAVEEMYALKLLSNSLGCTNTDCRQDGAWLDPFLGRASYIFNPTVQGIENADALLIIASNPRLEAPLLNARIRKQWRRGALQIAVIGEQTDFLYDYDWLGCEPHVLEDLVEGKHKFFKVLEKANNPLILIGQAGLSRKDGKHVLAYAAKLALKTGAVKKDWNGFGVLHTAAARVGGLDIGFTPQKSGKSLNEMLGFCKMFFFLGADEIDMNRIGDAFLVYIGTHGDCGAQRADVILPGATYTEKSGTYVNTEGRVQQTKRVVFPPGEAVEEWLIIRKLSQALGHALPFNSLEELRRNLYYAYPRLAQLGDVTSEDPLAIHRLAECDGVMDQDVFASHMKDFYLTNSIARSSITMAQCSALVHNALSKNDIRVG